MIPAKRLSVSGVRFVARYAITGPTNAAADRARAIGVEQTIEFPADLVADDDIRRHVIGRVESVEPVAPELAIATISYALETTGGELPQLLNVLLGNCSLYPGVRLVGLDLPPELLHRFRGPRHGIAGLRRLLGAEGRPLLCTALKPMGLSALDMAEIAATMVEGGIDVIKDDHGLANQPFAPWEARTRACAAAVSEANARLGTRTIYMPSLNAPTAEIPERARIAKDAGAGGLLILPGLSSLDAMRAVADDDAIGLPIMGHPAFLGAYVLSETHGIEHGLMFGTLYRLAGADMTVYPNYGGRFSFSQDACRSIADACRAPLGNLAPIFPTPGGGMTMPRLPELMAFYGADTGLLIGGDLQRGDLLENVRRMRAALDAPGVATPHPGAPVPDAAA